MSLSLVPLAGCQTLEYEDRSLKAGEMETYDTTHFLWGLTSEVVKIGCKKGVYRLYEGYSATDVLLNVFSLGVYNPGRTKVVCAS